MGDKVLVSGADKGLFDTYTVNYNQVQDQEQGNNPQVGAEQTGVPEETQAVAQPGNGEGANPPNVQGETINRARDVSLQSFEAVLSPKFKNGKNGTNVSFSDTLDDASSTTNLASRKGYVRFRHVKGNDGQKGLGLDRVTKWLWLPFSWRTNIKDADHNRAMRHTFYATVLEKFKGVSVPQEIMSRITGDVKHIDWSHNRDQHGKKITSGGVQGYTLADKNKQAALEANEVSQTLYRYNTVLNTTQARKSIVETSLRDVIRMKGGDQHKMIANPEIYNFLKKIGVFEEGAEVNDENYLERLISMMPEEKQVQLTSLCNENGTIKGTQEQLKASADEFLARVKDFVSEMSEKISKAVSNYEVSTVVVAASTLKEIPDNWVINASELLGDKELGRIHDNLFKSLSEDAATKKHLGIEGMGTDELRELVGCFCAGYRDVVPTKTPLKAVLDSMITELNGSEKVEDGDNGLADKKVDFNAYFTAQLRTFVKSYMAISKKIEAGSAGETFSIFSKRIKDAYSKSLNAWNDKFKTSCKEAFGADCEVDAPLSHTAILRDVCMNQFFKYFSEQVQARSDEKMRVRGQTQDAAIEKINQSDSLQDVEDLSDAFFDAFLAKCSDAEPVPEEVMTSYERRIASTLAGAVLCQRLSHDVGEDGEVVDYSVDGFANAVGVKVLQILEEDKKISTEQAAAVKEAAKGEIGIIGSAMAVWHKVSFAKNAFNVLKNIADFKVGGLIAVGTSVKNVGMAAWTLKTDIVNLFTDREKQAKADGSLETYVRNLRKAVSDQAFNVEDGTSVVSILQSALTSAAARKMIDGIMDSVKGKVTAGKPGETENLMTPLQPSAENKNAEWASSGASVQDMAASVKRLTEDVQKEIKSLQKGPFTLFGIHLSLFDNDNAQAGFENQLADRLKHVDNKTLAKYLGFSYSDKEANVSDYESQRKMLLQICTARYVEAMSLAMRKTTEEFSQAVAESYLTVHEAVIQSQGPDEGKNAPGQIPGALVRPPSKGSGYTLTAAGKAKLRNLAIKYFTEAYQDTIEHIVDKITGREEKFAAKSADQNALARDLNELSYVKMGEESFMRLVDEDFAAYKVKNPNATIDQMMWQTYPSVMMFYKTWDNAKLAMMDGFVKRIYNEAILANYSKDGADGLTLMKKAGEVEKGTFADKVRNTFRDQFAKNVKNYLKGTEEAFAQAFKDYDEEFFDVAEKIFETPEKTGADPEKKKLLDELKAMVRPNEILDEKERERAKSFFGQLLRLTFATWDRGQEMFAGVSAMRDEQRMKSLDSTDIDSVCRTPKFVNALLAKYAEKRENWNAALDKAKRELTEGLIDGKDMVERIFQSVAAESQSVEERKSFISKLFTAVASAVKGTKAETVLDDYRKEFGIDGAVTDVGQQEDLLKKMLAADRPFLSFLRKALKQEIDTEIKGNMVKYGGDEQAILDTARNNVAQKIWDFIPQLRKNWERLSTYDRYLSEAMKPAEGGAQAVEEAVEEVSWMMYQDFKDITQERDALQDGIQPKDATAELKNLDRNVDISGNLEAYYEKFVEIRDTFVKGNDGKAGIVAARREALLNDETVGGELRTTVAKSVDELLAAVKNLNAHGKNSALNKQGEALKEHAVWVLATKIASRCVSVEEVARLLAEADEVGKEPNWLRKLVNGVIAKVTDSVKALSVKSLLAERGIDDGAIMRPNLNLAAFKAKHPGVEAYTHTLAAGLTLTEPAREWLKAQVDEVGAWLKKQTGSNQGVVGETFVTDFAAALRSAAPARSAGAAPAGAAEEPFVAMGESEFAAIFDKICREKMPTLDDAIQKLDSQTVLDGVWTGTDPSVAANLQTAVIHSCLVALDDDLETGVDIDRRDSIPVVEGAEKMAEAARAYRTAFAAPNAPFEQIAGEFKVKDHLTDILFRRMKETTMDQIKATFLKEVEFEKKLPKDERYFTSQLNTYRDQYDKEGKGGWTDDKVLEKWLHDQLSNTNVENLKNLEKLCKERLAQGGDSFDRIAYDYVKHAFALTYAQMIGKVDAVLELERVINLEVDKGLAVKADARVNSQSNKLKFVELYEARYHAYPAGYYVKSLVEAFDSHVENVDFRDRNNLGFQRQEIAFREMRKKLRDDLNKIKGEYGKGYEAELVQRHALLTGFDGVRAFFKKDNDLAAIIHERALEACNNVWMQETMSKTNDIVAGKELAMAISSVLVAETFADKPGGEFKKLYEGYQAAHNNLLKVKKEVETDTAWIGKDKYEKQMAAEDKLTKAKDIQAKAQEDSQLAQTRLGEMKKQLEDATAKFNEKTAVAKEADARFAEAKAKNDTAVKEASNAQKKLDVANAKLKTAQQALKTANDDLNKIVLKVEKGKARLETAVDQQNNVAAKQDAVTVAENAVAEALQARDKAEKVKAETAKNLEAETSARATAANELKEAQTVKTAAEKSVEQAQKAAKTAASNLTSLTNELGTAQKKFANQPFELAKAKDREAREALRSYIASQQFTKDDLTFAKKVVADRIDEKQVKGYEAFIWKSIDATLVEFVKVAHDPQTFFFQKDWWRNGKVFGFLPIHSQVETTSQKSIFALAKKAVENQPPKDKNDKITLSEFLSYFAINKDNAISGVDNLAGLHRFIAYQVLGNATREVMIENANMGDIQKN